MKRRSGYGWLEIIMGILLILLGLFTILRPSAALEGVVMVYGIIAVLTGIADILSAYSIFDFRPFKRNGWRNALSISCCRHMGIVHAFPDMVYSPLHCSFVPFKYHPNNCGWLLLLFYYNNKRYWDYSGNYNDI